MLDENTCFRALRLLHRLWACVHTDEVRDGLEMYIEQTPPEHAREIFIRIVHRLILLSFVQLLFPALTFRHDTN